MNKISQAEIRLATAKLDQDNAAVNFCKALEVYKSDVWCSLATNKRMQEIIEKKKLSKISEEEEEELDSLIQCRSWHIADVKNSKKKLESARHKLSLAGWKLMEAEDDFSTLTEDLFIAELEDVTNCALAN